MAGEAKRRALANSPEGISERWRNAVGKGLIVGTPIYGGTPRAEYSHAMRMLAVQLALADAPWGPAETLTESLVPRARNLIASELLRSEMEWLLFIDADIVFQPSDVLALLESGHRVVGGAYPRKSIEWNTVAAVTRAGVSQPERFASSYVVNLLPEDAAEGAATFDGGGCCEVFDLPTGFLLIHRSVLEEMREKVPALQARAVNLVSNALALSADAATLAVFGALVKELPHLEYENDDGTKRQMWNFFPVPVAYEGGRWRYLSEDYGFCRMWHSIGGHCWLHTGLELHHIGVHTFQANRDLIMDGCGK